MSIFLFDTQKYFFEENEYDTHFLIFHFFIQNKISSYFEKETKWKIFFFILFLQKFKTHFFDKSERIFLNPNDVIKFINRKTRKLFFKFFKKPQHTYVCFIINLQKKHENRGVSSRVLNLGNFVRCVTLPKAGSLGSIHA